MKSSLLRVFVSFVLVTVSVLGASVGVLPARIAQADSTVIDFDSYSTGNINGQDGWMKTGSFDVAVVNNTYGYASFGLKSLRLSDAVTSGAFGDQTFVKPLVNAVGETAATAGAFSAGVRQSRFEMQFDIASTQVSQQPGMHVSVSPDRGDGSRMSYLRFEDGASGIDVFFDDVQQPLPCVPASCANFVETQIATALSRVIPHTIKLTMDTLDGPSNDVVTVYIDGALVQVGTSWEDYYRNDPEAAAEQSPRIVKSVLFRESGAATPANSGKGFLIDNLTTYSGPTPSAGLSASDTTICVGDSTTINVNLANVSNLYGYELKVNYPTGGFTAAGGFDSWFDTTANATIVPGWNGTPSGGVVKFAASKLAPLGLPVSGSGTVAHVTLVATTAGVYDITLSDVLLGDRDGNKIGAVVSPAKVTVEVCGSATVGGVVNLQGRAAPGPHDTLGTVTLTTAGFAPTIATIAANGTWSAVVPVAPGGSSYQLDAAHSLYLGNQLTSVALMPNDNYTAATTKLLGGDADNSGKIDVSDLSCIGSAFGGTPTVCGATGGSDINADGTVNILDLVLAGGNYDLSTPQGW